MPDVTINYMAVIAAALLGGMGLGFFWYGPLFAKPWMKLVGVSQSTMNKAGMGKTYAISTLGSLVMAYVLAHIVSLMNATTFVGGLQAGFWMWLGFIAPSMLNGVLFEKKPLKLYQIDAGYQLVALLLMGVVLASWR